ncbi:MAG: ferrous iron transport protein A [Clostridia bacterium]|nr:ferrous iron transport protein A [Clostridia bacterium]
MPLYKLACGDRATVISMDHRAALYGRLKELGIIEGTVIQKVMISPLGDPAAYLVRGALIAIRRTDASGIYVSSERVKNA